MPALWSVTAGADAGSAARHRQWESNRCTCDMDHEGDQWGDVDGIIAKYDWQEDTCTLAAAAR